MEESTSPTTEQVGPEAANDSKKERSTIKFPYGDLEDAEQVAQKVFDEGGTTGIDRLAAVLGHETTNSGAFNHKLATAFGFNLIERDGKQIKLSGLGRKIVNGDLSASARAEAFLGVELYRRIYDEYHGGTIPGDAGLENFMKQVGVAEKQTTKARQALKRSAEYAGFFQVGKDRLIAPNVQAVQNKSGNGNSTEVPLVDNPPALSLNLHPAVSGMLEGLPRMGGKWSEVEEVEWLKAFGHVLKVFHRRKDNIVVTKPVSKAPSPPPSEE
jgi:hypothetical protein